MNRIDKTFLDLKKRGEKALITFISSGDPNPLKSEEIVFTLEKAGANIIELGIPFSDPIADGPTIQSSSQRALSENINIKKVFQMVRRIRKRSEIPLILLTYFNPIYQFSPREFILQAKKAGVDGLIIPDLPPEEAKELQVISDKEELDLILLISPNSSKGRIKIISQLSRGFIYVVSVTGITGARKEVPYPIKKVILRIREFTDKPLCLGFGMSTPEQVKVVKDWVEGIIVGSALIKIIEKNLENQNLLKEIEKFVIKLKRPLSSGNKITGEPWP